MNIKNITFIICVASVVLATGCANMQKTESARPAIQGTQQKAAGHAAESVSQTAAYDFDFNADPETSQLFIIRNGAKTSASLPMPKEPVKNLAKTPTSISWTYPQKQMDIKMEKKDRYLEISLTSTGAKQFEWPKVQGTATCYPSAKANISLAKIRHGKAI
ncbi:hypothetical protein RE628_13180 [Paenibacillus sp. D2_2]|nr:hypothetical protein [Paenibacillus sp. D2_2]WMT43130.1 hypothetical protein RE628_13180 [Paenibacillus sp. D2_2]